MTLSEPLGLKPVYTRLDAVPVSDAQHPGDEDQREFAQNFPRLADDFARAAGDLAGVA